MKGEKIARTSYLELNGSKRVLCRYEGDFEPQNRKDRRVLEAKRRKGVVVPSKGVAFVSTPTISKRDYQK